MTLFPALVPTPQPVLMADGGFLLVLMLAIVLALLIIIYVVFFSGGGGTTGGGTTGGGTPTPPPAGAAERQELEDLIRTLQDEGRGPTEDECKRMGELIQAMENAGVSGADFEALKTAVDNLCD